MSIHPIRIFILGSCVSRDPFEHDAKGRFKVAGYVARSSFASLFARPFPIGTAPALLNSAFQRRMVELDAAKRVPETISAATFDWLLIDLIDERFDLLRAGDAIATLSAELDSAIGKDLHPEWERIASGSPEYRSLWLAGWRQLAEFLRARGLASRTIVQRARWAQSDDAGQTWDSAWIGRNNAFAEWCWTEMAAGLPELTWIDFPQSLGLADSRHKWGRAPYHFTAASERFLLDRLAEIAAGGKGDAPTAGPAQSLAPG